MGKKLKWRWAVWGGGLFLFCILCWGKAILAKCNLNRDLKEVRGLAETFGRKSFQAEREREKKAKALRQVCAWCVPESTRWICFLSRVGKREHSKRWDQRGSKGWEQGEDLGCALYGHQQRIGAEGWYDLTWLLCWLWKCVCDQPMTNPYGNQMDSKREVCREDGNRNFSISFYNAHKLWKWMDHLGTDCE